MKNGRDLCIGKKYELLEKSLQQIQMFCDLIVRGGNPMDDASIIELYWQFHPRLHPGNLRITYARMNHDEP